VPRFNISRLVIYQSFNLRVRILCVVVVSVLLAGTSVKAQENYSKIYKLGLLEVGRQMWYDYDEGHVLISASGVCSTDLSCQHLLQIDSTGSVVNLTTFDNIRASAFQEAAKAGDKIYYVGHPVPDTDRALHIFNVEKASDAGWAFEQSWSYTLPDSISGSDRFDIKPRMISMMANGSLLVSSFWNESPQGDWLMSVDTSNGDILWDSIIWTRPDQQQFQFVNSHPQHDSTVYLEALESLWIDREQDYLTWQISHTGEIIWEQQLPSSNVAFVANHAGLDISSKGHLIRAHRQVNNAVVSKYDSSREFMWTFAFDDSHPFFGQFVINNLTHAKNGDIIGAGTGIVEGNAIAPSGWLFRISPSGELLWSRKYLHIASDYEFDSGREDGGLLQAIELPDGDILAVGGNADTLLLNGALSKDADVWILRVDGDGCLEPDCEGYDQIITRIIDLPQLDLSLDFSIFPNPSSDIVHLRLSETCPSCSYTLYSSSGQQMYQVSELSSMQHSIDVSAYSPGWYPWILTYEGKVISQGTVIVQDR